MICDPPQVTGEGGENQLIQLMPDGQAQLIQVSDGHDGAHVIQVTPENLDLANDPAGLTIVNLDQQNQLEMDTSELVNTDQIHFQVSGVSLASYPKLLVNPKG